jgi:hypothetical protein
MHEWGSIPAFLLALIKKGDILEPMLGHTACQVKPALFQSDQPKFPMGPAEVAAFPGRGGFVIFIFFPRENPVKFTDPDGRTPEPGRWFQRNWDELLAIGFSGVEIGLGVAAAAETLGVSGAMIFHGVANIGSTVLKMSITTAIAFSSGDDAADKADLSLPASATGMISYGIGAMVESMTNARTDNLSEMLGAWGDVVDIGIGFGFGIAMKKEITSSINKLNSTQKASLMKLVGYTQANMAAKGITGLAERVMNVLTAKNVINKT